MTTTTAGMDMNMLNMQKKYRGFRVTGRTDRGNRMNAENMFCNDEAARIPPRPFGFSQVG
ncbi:hypothetical protein AGMMS49545_08440 [Betaproteobacteria bacterium]|nr:hypothetical protein AGMMS49545_08440 [Betaproteobacteria bacterium]GHU41428.1 hypothetical protein AGMMS50289_04560 [Betaproteobacteria bacterium]